MGALLATEKLDNDQLDKLFEAVAHKDVSTIRSISFSYQDTLIGLLQSAGPAATTLAAIERLDLPESARKQCRDLREVIDILIRQGEKDWTLTVDAAESRGFSYQSGISFSIFVPGASCEVGRGGRYKIENNEEATGFTLYVETLRSLLPEPSRSKRLLIAETLPSERITSLQAEGYITVLALTEYGNDEEEAKRLGCKYIYKNGKTKEIA